MTKSKGIRKKHNIGDIIIRPNGTQWKVGEDRKWIYIKKPREEWKTPLPKPKKKPKKKVEYNYPPLRIPENMRETQYSGYYITEDGKAYREPGKYDRNGHYGKINEYGLIYLKPAYRGNRGNPGYQYECINISVRDENGKFLKQIKKSIHQLVAEVFVPNPEGHTEILHLDDNNRNNHYTNLKWGTHEENIGLPEGTIRKGRELRFSSTPKRNSSNYIKKDGDWVLI